MLLFLSVQKLDYLENNQNNKKALILVVKSSSLLSPQTKVLRFKFLKYET